MHLGELSTFGKELSGPLVAFYSEWKFFFHPLDIRKERSSDQGHIFQITYQLGLLFSF